MIGSSCRGIAAALILASVPPLASCIDDGQATAQSVSTIIVNDNGAWSWFQDERVMLDAAAGRLLIASVADSSGTDGAARDGDVELTAYELASGRITRAVLHDGLGGNDHNAPALHVRTDGRYVAMYTAHSDDDLLRWRITATPGELDWQPEHHIALGAPVTYANIVPAGGRLLAFTRAGGRDPHVLESLDDGATWHHVGRLLEGPGRPYVRYAAGPDGAVHVFTTEQHPDDAVTSVYHGIVEGRRLLTSDGSTVDDDIGDDDAAPPEALTPVHRAVPTQRAWTLDVADAEGRPVVLFSIRRSDSRGTTNVYRYARYDGRRWHDHHLAFAGSSLYPGEPHYTGGAALDPRDPSRVVVSTDVDPSTGDPLIGADGGHHHELFAGRTTDAGASWQWTPLTAGSAEDNLRPVIPAWNGAGDAVIWLRGDYDNYRDYDLDVVARIHCPTPAAAHPTRAVQPGAAAAIGHVGVLGPRALIDVGQRHVEASRVTDHHARIGAREPWVSSVTPSAVPSGWR